jgi:Abortive infection C-terminus
MSGDLVRIKTRQVFREYLTSWTLREISDEFDAASVPCDLDYQPPASGQRRTLVEQYYHAVDWSDWRDVRKVLQAYEGVLGRAKEKEKLHALSTGYSDHADAERLAIKRLTDALKRDGFEVINGRIVTGLGLPSLDDIKETAAAFDAKHLTEQIRRIEQAVDSDPALAIGTAKELVETCCRTILNERGTPVTGSPDIPTLTKATLKELKLVPEGIPEQAKGSEIVKRLLSNLATIGHGLAENHGLYGTGHGKDGKTQSIKPRHAKLAVGAAATLVTFLFETHKETKS